MNCDYLFLEVQCSIKLNQIFLKTDNRWASLVYIKTINCMHLKYSLIIQIHISLQWAKYLDQNTLLFMIKLSSYLEKYFDKQPEHTVQFAISHLCLLRMY